MESPHRIQKPFYQRILVWTTAFLVGILAIGTLLDAISNAISVITLPIAASCSAIVVTAWIAIEVVMQRWGINWVLPRGESVVLRRLSGRLRLGIIGATSLLWLPIGISQLTSPSTQPVAPDTQLKQYCLTIINRHSYLHMIDLRRKIELKDIYVTLKLTTDANPKQKIALNPATSFLNEAESKTVDVYQALADEHLVVLGDPGAGKTTLLRHLAHTYATEYLNQGEGKIPIFVGLVDLNRRFNSNLMDWLNHRFPKQSVVLMQKLKSGQCIVLLDGLDEVSKDGWAGIRNEAQQLAGLGNQVVLTCRTAAYPRELMPVSFIVYKIVGFDGQQRRRLLRNFFRDSPQKGEELIKALQSSDRMWQMLSNPLLLSMTYDTAGPFYSLGDFDLDNYFESRIAPLKAVNSIGVFNVDFTDAVQKLSDLYTQVKTIADGKDWDLITFEELLGLKIYALLRPTWLDTIQLSSQTVYLSKEESQTLRNYLQAIRLLLRCKEETISITPSVWEAIESKFVSVDSDDASLVSEASGR